MGFGKQDGASMRWFDAKKGALWSKGPDGQLEAYQYVEGVVKGARVHRSEYDGRTIEQLQVRFDDPDGPEDLVISTTLVHAAGAATFARMLLGRLCNPANRLKGVVIRVSAYGTPDNEKVTCCAIRIAGQPDALPFISIAADEIDRVREACQLLETIYGSWDSGGPVPTNGQPAAKPTTAPELEPNFPADDDLPC